MSAPASSSASWGMGSVAFTVGYGLFALIVLCMVIRARRRLAAGAASTGTSTLDRRPYDIAYLNDGPGLAVLAALSSMWVAGTIVAHAVTGFVRKGRPLPVRAQGQLTECADKLERAIHLAAAIPIKWDQLEKDRLVLTSLNDARQRLEDAGLLVSAEQRSRISLTGLWMGPVGVLGLTPLVSWPPNDAWWIVVTVGGLSLFFAFLLLISPTRSHLGTTELKRLRRWHAKLAPGMRPDPTSYGPAYAGLAVGLFGPGAVDSRFAPQLGTLNYWGE